MERVSVGDGAGTSAASTPGRSVKLRRWPLPAPLWAAEALSLTLPNAAAAMTPGTELCRRTDILPLFERLRGQLPSVAATSP